MGCNDGREIRKGLDLAAFITVFPGTNFTPDNSVAKDNLRKDFINQNLTVAAMTPDSSVFFVNGLSGFSGSLAFGEEMGTVVYPHSRLELVETAGHMCISAF